jgi:serine/threonine protein kinase
MECVTVGTAPQLYRICDDIAEGAFSKVFTAEHVSTSHTVALKIGKPGTAPLIEREAHIYRLLSDVDGVPKLLHQGTDGRFPYLVLEKLGPSLQAFVNKDSKLSLKTVLSVALQGLKRLEQVHDMGIVHRDIKPSNMVVGTLLNVHKVYMIDFGLAEVYLQTDGSHRPCATGLSFVGSAKFASRAAHKGDTCSRKDDLEAFAYVLLYLLTGTLPWDHLQRAEDYAAIGSMKETATWRMQDVPGELLLFLHYSKMELAFAERPNYAYLRNMLLNLYKRMNFAVDQEMDWSKHFVQKPLKDLPDISHISLVSQHG